MPFLAPVLGGLIGAGGAIGSSLIGSTLGRASPSSRENTVLDLTAQGMQQGQDLARGLIPQGQNLIGMGAQGYQPVLNYWSSILSGNRPAATAALAPEISRIGEGYQAAGQTSAALNPRSGPSVSFLSELPFQQQRDVSNLLQTARPQAAQQLGGLSGSLISRGGNILGQATNALYGSTAAGRNILEQQQELRNLEAQRGQQIGGGLFSIFQRYGMPAIQSILSRPKYGPQPGDQNFVGPVQ